MTTHSESDLRAARACAYLLLGLGVIFSAEALAPTIKGSTLSDSTDWYGLLHLVQAVGMYGLGGALALKVRTLAHNQGREPGTGGSNCAEAPPDPHTG